MMVHKMDVWRVAEEQSAQLWICTLDRLGVQSVAG